MALSNLRRDHVAQVYYSLATVFLHLGLYVDRTFVGILDLGGYRTCSCSASFFLVTGVPTVHTLALWGLFVVVVIFFFSGFRDKQLYMECAVSWFSRQT